MFLPIWGIVAVVMFACFSYSIGRGSTANAADNAENDDTGGIFFIAFCISFFMANRTCIADCVWSLLLPVQNGS